LKQTINRRQFIGVVTASTILALTGCKGQNDNRAPEADIRVLYFAGPPEEKLIRDEIKDFTTDTGQTVQFKALQYDALRPEIEMSFKGDRRPFDVMFVDDIWLREFAESGRLIELSQFVEDIDEFNRDYSDTILKAEAYWPPLGDEKAKLYLIPHRADVQVLFYNKAIFDDNSVSEAFRLRTNQNLRIPETWDEYVITAKALTGIPFQGGLIRGCAETLKAGHFAFEFFACRYWAMAEGGTDFFDRNGNPVFASSAGISAIRHFQELLSEGALVPDSITADHDATIKAFENGNVALCPQWYTFHPTLKRSIKNLGVTFLPGTRNQNGSLSRTPSIGGGSFGIPFNSSKPKKGWAFIKYFTDKKFSEKSARNGAVVPRDSTYMDPDVREDIPELDIYRKSLEMSKFRPRVAHFSEVETIIGMAISQAILSPKENTQAILEEASKKASAITKGQ
jgi:multiple sugar transport system substrate-binding protein